MVSRVMRAIRVAQFGGPEVLKLHTDVPVPEVTEPTQVLVKVSHIGVNPVDTYIRSGTHTMMPNLPYTPGFDCSGEVVALGGDVTDLALGDRVLTFRTLSGAYAEYALTERRFVLKSGGLTHIDAAAVGAPGMTAWQALFGSGRVQPTDRVLIRGASGSVGEACIQLAPPECRVSGTAGSSAALKRLKLDEFFDYTSPNHADDLRAAGPWDVIIEMRADLNLPLDVELLKQGGRVVVVGSRGPCNDLMPRYLMTQNASIVGFSLGSITCEKTWELMRTGMSAAVEKGILKPTIAAEYPLEGAAQAHTNLMGGPATGKHILCSEK